ncbi:MAG: hypothetical protein AB7O44_01380 [Hyphomicrobiaceae bacterium]
MSVRRVFEANDSAYMLLDFIKGRTLEAWLQELDSPATQEELDLISVPLLNALGLVHANRTWHLDISPENPPTARRSCWTSARHGSSSSSTRSCSRRWC